MALLDRALRRELGKDMRSALEASAIEIIMCLRGAGHLAFFVGGCVRDRLLGLEPHDYDIVTDAMPSEIQRLFPHTILIGAAFGTVLVIHHDYQYHVSTFRGSTQDSCAEELIRSDVAHRDFTINAMAADPESGVIYDFVNGRSDLEQKLIRAVPIPEDRFTEDPLRLLRAIRFVVQLGFTLDPETEAVMIRLSSNAAQASPERIHQELVAMLLSPSPAQGFRLLHRTALLPVLLPEVSAMEGVAQPPEFHPEGDVWTHTLLMLEHMHSPSPELALAVLLHDVGKPPTYTVRDRIRFDRHPQVGVQLVERIATRYRWPRAQVERVCALVQDHLIFINVPAMRRSTLVRWLRKPHFPELLELHRLDCLGSHRSLTTYEFCRAQLTDFTAEQRHPVRLLTGDDLKALGYPTGPQYKEILSAVEDAQLEGMLQSTDDAKTWVRQHFPASEPLP
jgi:tRNA nucleotidyltransferase/poly(A) polymerase